MFEAKNSKRSKSCRIHKESHKIVQCQVEANLTLKVKVNVTSFQTHLRHLDDQTVQV